MAQSAALRQHRSSLIYFIAYRVRAPCDRRSIVECEHAGLTMVGEKRDAEKETTLAEASNAKAIIPPKPILVLAIVATTILALTFFLFLVGFFIIPVVLSVVLLVVGCYAIAIFLAQQYKITEQRNAISDLLGAAEKQGKSISDFVVRKHNGALITQRECEEKIISVKNDFLNQTNLLEKKLAEAEKAAEAISRKYLEDVKKNLVAKITPDNLAQSKERLSKATEFCRRVGYDVSDSEITGFLAELKTEFEAAVRKQAAKEEQAKIKERIREEQKAEADFERERKRLEQEQKLVERLLQEARAKATAETSAQIEELERRLADAQDRQRSLSMAQQTKAGNVYVISNIGSFGEDVFKIGMTRRLDPMDRVRELGDASVPFPFDVHMMISSENAPALENSLHRAFNARRLNKVNFRKEFFRVSIEEIRGIVEQSQGVVEYVATPEALQYRESISMDAEEFATISEVMKDVSDDDDE